MSEDKKYNGWNNYETWLVKLWLDNDEGTDSLMREFVQDARENPEVNQFMDYESRVQMTLKDKIKDFIEEMNPLADTADLFTDLLNSALSEVDWYEIAEAYLEDNPAPEDEELEAED